ncbi:MAG: PilT/PilU family type 4a pilus ATPase [Sedimentisphaerales bacterium]|nr:PilT/PilU family type 4a pilus ATPase [Sedimentisphaerales bacterium]
MAEIRNILVEAVEREASDVHINVGLKPIIRINTELVETEFPVITDEEASEIVLSLIGQERFEKFEKIRDIDFSTSISDPNQRFRVNAHYQRDTIAISFRLISDSIPSLDELNLPEKMRDFADLPRGLVLVTGHTGAGKSTTLASTISLINQKYRKRVITIEDPIEYWLTNDKCMIEQREVGSDCPNFATGLRHILRQDPDIIMVGEMRDLETTSFALTAAETGHLVFSTLHTVNASQSIERVIDIYPANQQTQARTMLANALQAVVSQTLFRRIDQAGMVPSTEILLCTSAVRNCIRENRIYEIPNIIETSRRFGMHLMDNSIAELAAKGYIEREEAILRSNNRGKMEKLLRLAENSK